MADPFLSEIRIFSFNFPPRGWAFCNGQSMPINQNQALFALLGTTYGGNGQTTFNLPNLQGRLAIHTGNGHTLGEAAGASAVTVTPNTLPQHSHPLSATTTPADPNNGNIPTATSWYASSAGGNVYGGATSLTPMNAASVSTVGGSQPHNNMMPYVVLSFCIALQGIFPSRN